MGLEPEALFPVDLEAVGWLSLGAMAPRESAVAHVFQKFLQDWEKWVNDLGGEELVRQVQAAREAIVQQSGAKLSDALDKASASLYEKLHGIPSEEAWGQPFDQLSRQEKFVNGLHKRKELKDLLDRTLEKIREVSFVDPKVGESVQAYRKVMIEGKDLEKLDSLHADAVKALSQAVFKADRGSQKEVQLLKLLAALAPEQADKIREALNKPSAGLEEQQVRELEAAIQRDMATIEERLGRRLREEPRLLDPRLLGVGPQGLKEYGREITQFMNRLESQVAPLNMFVILIGKGASSYEGQSSFLLGRETSEAAAGVLRRWKTGRLEYFATAEEAEQLATALKEWNASLVVTGRPVDTLPLILRQILSILAGIDVKDVDAFYKGINLNELADHLKELARLGV